jgi:hypothetical protein
MTSSASFKEVVINDPSAKDGLTFLVADHENIIKLMDQSRDAGTLLQKKNYCDDLIRSISRNASRAVSGSLFLAALKIAGKND